ncbi:MAG: dihydrolipoyl dehydrogenase [Syntrophobacteraceae bacterium]|nr:dihydrolipoyl dehydrogenase [Syntrophobacteraceae bacterium]
MVMGEFTQETQVLVIGGGPGGYAAAFRAADLGLEVSLVDMGGRLGGVCLFRGCIPSKSLLYVSELLHDAERAKEMGISFGEPRIDLERVRAWKNQVTEKLAGGLMDLAGRRGVQVIRGRAVFEGADRVRLLDSDVSHMKFKHAIVATGSHASTLPGGNGGKGGRIMTSTGALALADIPERLLVIGGGYVGVELGSVYASLGSRVTLVENSDRIMEGADTDLVQPLSQRLEALFEAIHTRTKVVELKESETGVEATFEGDGKSGEGRFDRALVAIGRRANSRNLGLENTKVVCNEAGFIQVDERMRTADERIFAVGDVVGGVMLAHKAMHEGKVAAEVISGRNSAFDYQTIPAVVYTDPQIAWCGLTEQEAKRRGQAVKVTRFPWSASGRAASMGLSKGLTKFVVDPESGRILGMGIVGREAGEMISEGVLAVEMGALAEDVALSMHPHPTLAESEEEAAEAFLGSSTHILPQKKR